MSTLFQVPGDCSSYPTAKFLSQKDQRITYSFRTMPVSNDSPCIRGTPKCEVADPATCGQLSLHVSVFFSSAIPPRMFTFQYITTSGESKAFDTLNNQSITEFLACQSDGLWGTTASVFCCYMNKIH